MPLPHPQGLNVTRAAIDAENRAADKFALKCAGDDIRDLYEKLCRECKDVESPELEEALAALEEHGARLRVLGDPDN